MQIMMKLIALLCISGIWCIGIPLHEGPRCMLIQGGFDVIMI
jgi:hypothetical protein